MDKFLCSFGQYEDQGDAGKHKWADVCKGQCILEIPMIEPGMLIDGAEEKQIGNEDHCRKKQIEKFCIFHIFHAGNGENIDREENRKGKDIEHRKILLLVFLNKNIITQKNYFVNHFNLKRIFVSVNNL
jgi:hypothetical protein